MGSLTMVVLARRCRDWEEEDTVELLKYTGGFILFHQRSDRLLGKRQSRVTFKASEDSKSSYDKENQNDNDSPIATKIDLM